jgi:hypothetical protein
MKTNPGVITLAANNDIVEMVAYGRLYWATRKRFEEIEETSRMLESVISLGATLLIVQHIFDDPDAFEEVRSRFDAWSTS